MTRERIGWHGCQAVIVTPFTANGDIDETGYREVVDSVIDAGCHGIISAGSTGEFFLMSKDELRRVYAIAVDQAGDRVPIIAGTSAIRTEDVVELTQFAAEVGCAGAMIMPPYYGALDDDELFEFYSRISGEAGLPILLYKSLAVRTELTADRVKQLMEIENIVAIKDSYRELIAMSDLIRTCGPELRVFSGRENWLLPALVVGAVGSVSLLPPVVGSWAPEMYDAFHAGDLDLARELHYKISRAFDLTKVSSNQYMAIKESMNLLGKPGGCSRPPVMPLAEDEKAELRVILEDLKLLTPAEVTGGR